MMEKFLQREPDSYWDISPKFLRELGILSDPDSSEQLPTEDSNSKGLKFDQGKARIDLIDPGFLEGLGGVLGFGASKYAAHNWRGGIDISRLVGSAYRHLGSFNRGEDKDQESNLSHLYHLAANAMMAAWLLEHKPEFDDRFKHESED